MAVSVADAVRATSTLIRPGRVLLIGELHGTYEFPSLVVHAYKHPHAPLRHPRWRCRLRSRSPVGLIGHNQGGTVREIATLRGAVMQQVVVDPTPLGFGWFDNTMTQGHHGWVNVGVVSAAPPLHQGDIPWNQRANRSCTLLLRRIELAIRRQVSGDPSGSEREAFHS
jgi:hypothetical protein